MKSVLEQKVSCCYTCYSFTRDCEHDPLFYLVYLKKATGGSHHYLHYTDKRHYSEKFIKLPEVTQ